MCVPDAARYRGHTFMRGRSCASALLIAPDHRAAQRVPASAASLRMSRTSSRIKLFVMHPQRTEPNASTNRMLDFGGPPLPRVDVACRRSSTSAIWETLRRKILPIWLRRSSAMNKIRGARVSWPWTSRPSYAPVAGGVARPLFQDDHRGDILERHSRAHRRPRYPCAASTTCDDRR